MRSWRLDGQPGPLSVTEADTGSIHAVAVTEDAAGTIIITAGNDRTVLAIPTDGPTAYQPLNVAGGPRLNLPATQPPGYAR